MGQRASIPERQQALWLEGAREADCAEENTMISNVFTWSHGGRDVKITGSFLQWESVDMVRCGPDFQVSLELSRDRFEYKFIVDDAWRVDPSAPVERNEQGNENNIIDLRNYNPFDLGGESLDSLFYNAEGPGVGEDRFSTSHPKNSDVLAEVPQLPKILTKSPYVADPSNAIVNIALQPLVRRPFHEAGAIGRARGIDNLLLTSTTERHRTHYSTALLWHPIEYGRQECGSALGWMSRAIDD